MPDLFISYNSQDEVWANRFFLDIRSRFPMIKPFWARDVDAIPVGEPFRPVFQGEAQNATNFIVFWSQHAQLSNEVGPEIQSFLQNRQTRPTAADGAKRKLFYVPLEAGVDYGGLVDLQGFPDFRGVYDANAGDRGISGLAAAPASDNWSRMVRAVGNAVLEGQATQAITLALMVVTDDPQTGTNLLDPILNLKLGGPSLNEFLQSVGLSLADAKARYTSTAFEWRPFGTSKTIIDLAEDIRELANQSLGPSYQFHWRPVDFVEEARKVRDEPALRRLIESLSEGPSVVVTDPVSLYHPLVQSVFKRLTDYAKKPQSMIVSMSPLEAVGASQLYSSLVSNGSPVLDAHLYPQIPASEPVAFCGVNVQHIVQVEHLIRNGLGHYYLQKKKSEAKPLVSSGV